MKRRDPLCVCVNEKKEMEAFSWMPGQQETTTRTSPPEEKERDKKQILNECNSKRRNGQAEISFLLPGRENQSKDILLKRICHPLFCPMHPLILHISFPHPPFHALRPGIRDSSFFFLHPCLLYPHNAEWTETRELHEKRRSSSVTVPADRQDSEKMDGRR
jgi:hypothetical protein